MKTFAVAAICVCACFCTIFAQDTPEEKKQSEPEKKVLMAFEDTRFKKALIEKIKEQLVKKDVAVEVVSHEDDGLKKYAAADYAAVFITNSGVNSKVRPWVTKWIAKNSDAKEIILLHTTQRSSWEVKADVQAVTSASSMKKVDDIAKKHAGLIEKMLTSGSGEKPASEDD